MLQFEFRYKVACEVYVLVFSNLTQKNAFYEMRHLYNDIIHFYHAFVWVRFSGFFTET